MRDKQGLFELDDIAILLQYLYISKDHYIIINNGICDLKIFMDDNYYTYSINMNFPDVPPTAFNPSINNWLGIIDKLKEMKSEYDYFKNKWEEIKIRTEGDVGMNKEHFVNGMCL